MASKYIKGIVVTIGGDTTELGKALKTVDTQASSLQRQLTAVNKLLKLDPTNTTLLTEKQELLTRAIDDTKKKLELLKKAQDIARESFEKNEITEEEFNRITREIGKTEAQLKGLQDEADKFGSVFAQQMKAAGEKVSDFGEKIERVGQKLSGLSIGAAAVLGYTAKEAITFESAWVGVTKTVEGTDEELENLKQGLLDLSQETASSAVDIAAVAESAGQLGIKTEDVLDFTKTMVMLGDTTNLSANEAAIALAKFANVTQMSANDYGKLGSTIVDLGNNFATTEEDIVEMATRLASTGEITGLSESQILALATTLSSLGIEAEAGGTSISKLLKKVYTVDAGFDNAKKAVDSTGMSLRDLQLLQANNNTEFRKLADGLGYTSSELKGYMNNVDTLNKFADTAGISAEEFRKAYAENAVGAISLFIKGLGDTERTGKNAVEILNEMGLTEVRLSNSILAMASSGDVMTSAVQTASDAWGENSALTKEAEKRYATTESQIIQLKNTITELCVVLGETLLPKIQSTVDKLKEMVEAFQNLDPHIQNIIIAITGITAVLSPVLIVIGKVVQAIGSIMEFAPKAVSAFNKIKDAISLLGSSKLVTSIAGGLGKIKGVLASLGSSKLVTSIAGAFKSVGAAIGGLVTAHPIITAVVAVIGVLVGAFIYLWNNCDGFKQFWIDLWEKIKVAFNDFVEWCKGAFESLGEFFTVTIPEWFNGIVSTIVNFFTVTIPEAWNNFLITCSTFIDSIVQFFAELPGKIWTWLTQVCSDIAQWGIDLYNNAVTSVQSFIDSVVQWFNELPYKIGYALGYAIGTLIKWGVDLWNWATTEIPKFINGVVTFFAELPGKIWTWLVNVVTKIGEWGSQMIAKAKTAVTTLINNTVTFFKQLPGKIWAWLVETVNKVATWGSNMIAKAKAAISQMISTVVSFIKQLPSKIWTWLVNTVNKVATWGSQMISKATTAIKNVVSKVVSIAKELPGKIWNAIVGAVQKMAQWGSQLLSKAKTAITNVSKAIVEGLKSIPSKIMSVGRDIVEGVWSGISGAAGWIKDRIFGFADGLVQGVKDALGINSPSKVFRDVVGSAIPEGIAVGITANAGTALKSLKDLNNEMTDQTFEVNPTVTQRNASAAFNRPTEVRESNEMLANKLDNLFESIKHLQIVLDTGTLVGETVDKFDIALASKQILAARGV